MPAPTGFTWTTRRDETEVVIRHHGRVATVLRGGDAARFLRRLTDDELGDQHLMARLTGNYRRGNERRGP